MSAPSMSASGAKVAVVTGGGSGIGFACAELLARSGWRVVIAGRSLRRLEQAAVDLHAEIGASGAPVIPLALDQSDPESSRRLIDAVASRFGRIDALVISAGAALVRPIEQTDLQVIQHIFSVNATGPALLTHLAWPIFSRQRSGCVVNIGSYASFDPFPGFFAYAASKAAVSLMARSAAKEGASIGVRAFCVAPGAVETELLRSAFDESVLPRSACLVPREVARVVMDCIDGRRDRDNGLTIYIKRAEAPAGAVERGGDGGAGVADAGVDARIDEMVR